MNKKEPIKHIYFAIYTCETKSSEIEKEQVRLHEFIKIPLFEDMSAAVRDRVEDIAREYAADKILTSGFYCAVRTTVIPHLNFNFDTHDECIFPFACTVGSDALIECIRNNYGYFRDKIGLDDYRNAIELKGEHR